jgi:hypothetical protein
MDGSAAAVNEKLTNLNSVSNWTAAEYGILNCPKTAGFPDVGFSSVGPANLSRPTEGKLTADYDS